MQPGPCFRRSHGTSKDVTGGRSPTRPAHNSPLSTFTFRQINVRVTGKINCRNAVVLHAQQSMVTFRPVVQRLKKTFVVKFRQRLAPVAPDLVSLWPNVSDQRR